MASLAALRDALPRRLPAEFGYLASAARPFPAAPNGSAVRRAPNLLITGCGRSGTHALASLLRRHGVQAKHEGRGSEATLGWPYAGRALDWRPLWPMSAQPRATDAHEPIFKVHRHPISAVASIANGFTTSGACRNPSERRWDARAWHCASTFVPLPLGGARLGEAPRHAAATTCTLGRRERLRLALHYWVKWNLLADRWAAHAFAVEAVSFADLAARWCAHCDARRSCACPPHVRSALAANATAAGGGGGGGGGGGDRVRARRGHGRRKATLTWEALREVDAEMAAVAWELAREYGYGAEPGNRTARS